MLHRVVITGLGMITPLGQDPSLVLRRMQAGEQAFAAPTTFDPALFSCPVCASVNDFDFATRVDDAHSKTLRLMNRDAQLAVAAVQSALSAARISVGQTYGPGQIALYGATGLAGVALAEVGPLFAHSRAVDGSFDPQRFGDVALRRVRPVLSFKILSNMPICFVSIFCDIQGPNAVYNPWEGQGAQAIASGIRAISRGLVPCAIVGGCDVKTHELAFLSLEQQGVFRSWQQYSRGTVPGEGAVFLVLEDEERAQQRGANIHASLADYGCRTVASDPAVRGQAYGDLLSPLAHKPIATVISAADGQAELRQAEQVALSQVALATHEVIAPKQQAGNLFAAAAALQVAVAATRAQQRSSGECILANCFGHGSEQAAFVLESTE